MKLTGLRVIRGPDWCHGNDDGGLGYLGTVVKVFPHNNAVLVTWDVGTETVCRAGIDGAFDLRVFDNAQTGVVHDDVTCNICRDKSLNGMRWKCVVCKDYDECARCYMGTRNAETHAHNTNHAFVRYTTDKSLVVRVAPRRRSNRLPIYGIFPGAIVTKVVLDSNGDEPCTGIVQELTKQQDSYRGAVKVNWNDGMDKTTNKETELPVYRVGCGGTVELKLIEPASPGDVYIEHLPVLDLTVPIEVNYKIGDTVRVELNIDIFKVLQQEHGGWDDTMEEMLWEDGRISDILVRGQRTLVSVRFHTLGSKCQAVYTNSLTKIYRVNPRDTVHVTPDVNKMRALQRDHGGWQQAYASILGKTGHVIRINESGDAVVDIHGDTVVINPDCLTVTGEPVDNNTDSELPPLIWTHDKSRNKPEYSPVPLPARRWKPPNGVSIGVGTRVVRGPDWSSDFTDQDGGEGHLGSLVEICGQSEEDMYPRDCVVVQWDNSERNVYRAGYENAYDLRMFDNAGIGIKHEKSCSDCNINNVLGLLWTCQQCPDVSLCTECYGADKHDINHAFTRFDHAEDQGVNVPKRGLSRKSVLSGIFEKSKVQRGPDWRWQNQDGGAGKEGEVISIVNFSPGSDRDAAEVTWQNGYTNVYRLGYRGRLDLKCVKPAKGGWYYRDHLPILKLATGTESKPEEIEEIKKIEVEPTEIQPIPNRTNSPILTSNGPSSDTTGSDSSTSTPSRFKTGDRVKIEIDVDVLKMIEETRNAWNPGMTECIGMVGNVIVCRGVDVTVDFEEAGRWTFSETCLNKVKEFGKGDIVKVKENIDYVRTLQTERGGWNDLMIKVMGKKGKVEDVDEDGDIMVYFGGYSWTLNPECLQEAVGPADSIHESNEELDEELYSKPSQGQSESQPSSKPPLTSEEEKLEEFFGTIFVGDSGRVERIIQREPQLMLMEFKGELAIHQAAQCGNMEIATTLFKTAGKDTILEIVDTEGNTPLLSAAKGGHSDMVKYLVDSGCNKDAANKNSETAVHIAVGNKNVPLLTQLRDCGFDVNQPNALQQSPLFEAISLNDPDVLTTILGWPNVDVKKADSIGFTPFASACRSGNKRAVMGILEIAPDELNRQKEDGYTGLHVAVSSKRTEIVSFLINKPGIDVNPRTTEGRTPLHIASEGGQVEIARLLIDGGSDVLKLDTSNKSCLHVCAESTMAPENQRSAILDLAKLLLQKGVLADCKDTSGKLAVDYLIPAYRDEFTELVKNYAVSRTRGASVTDPLQSLPANFGSDGKQDIPTGPSSLNINSAGHGQTPTQGQGQLQGDVDPEFCEACDEEPIRYRLEPCRHLVCLECKPAKKAKRKLCSFCGDPITDVVEFDQR